MKPDAEWVEIDAKRVRVENPRGFGGPWLAMHLVKLIGLGVVLAAALPRGDEAVAWNLTSLILGRRGLLEKIGQTTARFPPKMLPLTDQWVDFSSGRAIAPTLQ
jgi:hypothetical protein